MKKKQGFACLSPEKRREMSVRGGKAKPAATRSFSLDNDLARRAGRLGGKTKNKRSALCDNASQS